MGLKNIELSSNLIRQFRLQASNLLLIYSPWAFLLLIASLQTKIPLRYLTRDPAAIFRQPFYYGFFSHIGVILWCGCAAICLFCSAVIFAKRKKTKLFWFLLTSGILTTFLFIDDLFLVHEVVFPTYLKIPGELVYLFYLIFIIFYILKFYKIVLNTNFILLAFAFLFFGISVVVDKLVDLNMAPMPQAWLENQGELLLDDGTKLLGIVSWCAYYIKVCFRNIKQLTLQ